MASFSGACSGSGVTGYLDVSAVTLSGSYPNIVANYSASVRWHCTYEGSVYYNGSTVTINGKTWTGNISFSVNGANSPSYGSQSFSVGLGSSRSVSISVKSSVSTYPLFNFSASGTVSSPAVEAATNYTISSISGITENSCVVSHTLNSTRNYWYVKLYDANTGTYWNLNTNNGNGTTTITGLNPNQTYTFKVRVYGRNGAYLGESAAKSITTLGKSGIGNQPSYKIGTAFDLLINGYSDLFTHTAQFTIGSYSFQRTNLKRGTITIQPTDSENNEIYTQLTTAVSKDMNIQLTTFVNGVSIGNTSGTGSVQIDQSICAPDVNSFTYLDTNAVTVGLTGNNQYIIQGHSEIEVRDIAAAAKHAASLQKYRVMVDGSAFESTATTIHTTQAFADTGITVYAIDSRNLQGSLTKAFLKFIPYAEPKVEIRLHRRNDIENSTSLILKGSYDPMMIDQEQKNDLLSVTYCYKEEKETVYGNEVSITVVKGEDGSFTFNNIIGDFPSEHVYHFQIRMTDKLGTYTYSAILNAGVMSISIKKNSGNYAIGINKIPELDKGLDIAGDIRVNGIKLNAPEIYPVGSIYISIQNVNPAQYFGGVWERYAQGKTLIGVDEGDSSFQKAGISGGHKELQSHTHAVTIANSGAHTHTVSGSAASAGNHNHSYNGWYWINGSVLPASSKYTFMSHYRTSDPTQVPPSQNAGGAHTHSISGTAASNGAHVHTATAANTGSGNGGNLPPYMTTYFWLRTA